MKRSESHSIPGEDEGKAEPAVAANVAVEMETSDPSRSKPAASIEEQAKPLLAKLLNRHPLSDTRSTAPNEASQSTSVGNSKSELFANRVQVNSSMERLNAALIDDSLDSQGLPQPSLTNLEERNRVETMLVQAKELLEAGQFEPARQTALKALELGDSAQLDYSPDEERPIDFVRRIESQIESLGLNGDAKSENAMTASPAGKEIEKSDGARSPDGLNKSLTKDESGLSRIRRDITTLFRRGGKKVTGSESDATDPNSKVVQSASASSSPEPSRNGRSTSSSRRSEAIVLANRSVTLGPLESVSSGDQNNEFVDSSNALEAVFDAPQTPVVTMPVPDGEKTFGAVDPSADLQMPKPPRRADDPSIGQLDFEVSESTGPFQEPLAKGATQPESISEPSEDPKQESDWTWYYVGFAMSLGVALYFYRRGAT